MRIFFRISVCFASVYFYSSLLFAQSSLKIVPESYLSLDKIIVTPTKSSMPVEQSPGSVEVITNKDMEKRNVLSVDDALDTSAGVIVNRGKGIMDYNSSIMLRGMPGQGRTMVMMDGVVLNSPYANTVFLNAISTESLERIEVVKGPSSSLYGGSAMGGVIHLITKMPETREVSLSVGGGGSVDSVAPDNFRRLRASYGDVFLNDKLKVYFSGDYQATDGYRSDAMITSQLAPLAGLSGYKTSRSVTGGQVYIIGDKGRNRAKQDSLHLKTEYLLTAQSKLRFSVLRSTGGYDYDNPRTFLADSSGAPKWIYSSTGAQPFSYLGNSVYFEQLIYSSEYEVKMNKMSLKLGASYFDQAKNWSVTPDGRTPNDLPPEKGKLSTTPNSVKSLDLQLTTSEVNNHLLTFGAAVRESISDTSEYSLSNWRNEESREALGYESRGADRSYALFAQDEFLISKNVVLFTGLRSDWWETTQGFNSVEGSHGARSKNMLSPKVSIVYTPASKTALRLSGGQAFRAPSIYDLYRTWTTSSGTTYKGNPNLKPESSFSWEVGVTQGLSKDSVLKLTYFENYIVDMIYSTTSGTVREKLNAGKGQSKGIEFETEYTLSPWVSANFNYTYTSTEIVENSAVPLSVGKKFPWVPEHMLNSGLDFKLKDWGAYLGVKYMSKRFSNDLNTDRVDGVQGSYDAHTVVDAKVRHALTSQATISLAVNNLMNLEYYTSSRSPGRTWFADFTYRF
ncbi:TonB-dependent receptor [Bdellovibrio bacteriovorus W]|nr:TonB-dependent receptor [Bdellovibrio bacteriovorus W]